MYWIRWSVEGDLTCASDPQLLAIPADRPQLEGHSRGVKIELARIEFTRNKSHSATPLFVHVMESYNNGSLHDILYSFEDVLALTDASIEARSAIAIPPSKDRRIKSSRVVDEEDELIDFVVPDDLMHGRLATKFSPPFTPYVQRTPKTRDWSDIINLQTGSIGEIGAEAAISNLYHATETAIGQTNVQTLSEILPEIRISDIEEATSALSALEHEHEMGMNDGNGPQSVAWRATMPTDGTLPQRYERAKSRYMKPLSAQVLDRFKVHTERLCRTVAFEEYTSLLTGRPFSERDIEQLPALDTLHVTSSPLPPSSPPSATPAEAVDPTMAALRQYTSFSESPATARSSTSIKNILAHIPSVGLLDPESYSYNAVEDRLKLERTQQELDDLDERERRKVERAALRKQKKESQQAKKRDAVTQQNTLVPGLVLTSPARDTREVQSSQLAPLTLASSQIGFTMTQPERGTHGERRKVVRKEGKPRVKGF